jgi:sulfur relay (sulfurtransferase) complex TusBCD TusD component (DsrE family)
LSAVQIATLVLLVSAAAYMAVGAIRSLRLAQLAEELTDVDKKLFFIV